jgi:protein-L-isoaspartate(D-aspartate) O-methyltransferase
MKPSPTESIETVRRFYAEELCRLNHISNPAILAAFATVPRERFVGPGPWIIQRLGESWKTGDTDARHVYLDALIVLDETRHLNNGQPSLWAFHLDELGISPGDHILHLGCGTGYYTAIMAELTGSQGKVTAVEIDESLAARARIALAPWPQVSVFQGSGALGPFQPSDVIAVSAGATHPLPAWLAAVKPQGKLLFPLTSTRGPGTMAHLKRESADWFHAELISSAFFVDFLGARDTAVGNELAKVLKRDHGASVRSLRCDPHRPDSTCWLHGNGWCFSLHAPKTDAETKN